MFVLKILPVRKLPLKVGNFFLYYWSAPLPLGAVVRVNFRNKPCLGIVLESQTAVELKDEIKKSPFAVKKIKEVISDQPIIPVSLISLAKFISEYYFCSLPSAIKTVLPSNFLRLINLLKKESATSDHLSNQSFQKIKESPIVIQENNFSNFQKQFDKFNNFSGQTLILTPTIFHLKFYQDLLPIKTSIYQRNEKDSLNIWQGVIMNESMIVLGLRSAVFLPFQDLKTIIIISPGNSAYKSWDQKPYYQAVKLAQKIASYHKADLIYLYD